MKAKLMLVRLFFGLAFFWALAINSNSLYYLYSLLQWGLTYNWHFADVAGFGFRFLFHFLILSSCFIFLLPYFFLLKKINEVSRFLNRKFINIFIFIGSLSFVFSVAIEVILQRVSP